MRHLNFAKFNWCVTLSDFRRKTYLVSSVLPQVAHVRCARLLMRIVSTLAHFLFFVSRPPVPFRCHR
jgi:hypothetical protein